MVEEIDRGFTMNDEKLQFSLKTLTLTAIAEVSSRYAGGYGLKFMQLIGFWVEGVGV